jgi:cytochrome c-type biogenesis protein CcmE
MGFVAAGLVTLGVAAALVTSALQENITFFYSPTEIAANQAPEDRRLRVGGLVKTGSVRKLADGTTTAFILTDMANDVTVVYNGILPDLFREGQGIIAEGRLEPTGRFRADEVLAKHDETYMPKEVAESLKAAGVWQGDAKK